MRYMIVLAALLAGCSSPPKWVENRVVCTVDKSEAHFLSKWGLFGITSEIAEPDARVICKP